MTHLRQSAPRHAQGFRQGIGPATASAEALPMIGWWDWDHASLKAALPDIRKLDIGAFIENYR